MLRALLSVMKAYEYSPKFFSFSKPGGKKNPEQLPIEITHSEFTEFSCWDRFKKIYWGVSKEEPHPDLRYNFYLGIIELSAYYYLMQKDLFLYIGGWLGLKIVSQWDTWKANRNAINRFFIAVAIQLIFCYVCLANWHLPPISKP